MTSAKRTLGNRGEELACGHLISLGHTVLARNWTSGHLEVDIITLDRQGVHFVEVKSRTAPVQADPQDNVGPDKQRKLVRAANMFLNSAGARGLVSDAEVFFDVVSVVFSRGSATINYFPQAFIPMYL